MAGIPEGWESDYDGKRWFYRYKSTGVVQYHFPQPGDEFPEFFDPSAGAIDLAPEELLISEQQTKRRSNIDGSEHVTRSSGSRRKKKALDDVAETSATGYFDPGGFMYFGPGGDDGLGLENELPSNGKSEKWADSRVSSVAPTPNQGQPATLVTGGQVNGRGALQTIDGNHNKSPANQQPWSPVGFVAELGSFETAKCAEELAPVEMDATSYVAAPIQTVLDPYAPVELPTEWHPSQQKQTDQVPVTTSSLAMESTSLAHASFGSLPPRSCTASAPPGVMHTHSIHSGSEPRPDFGMRKPDAFQPWTPGNRIPESSSSEYRPSSTVLSGISVLQSQNNELGSLEPKRHSLSGPSSSSNHIVRHPSVLTPPTEPTVSGNSVADSKPGRSPIPGVLRPANLPSKVPVPSNQSIQQLNQPFLSGSHARHDSFPATTGQAQISTGAPVGLSHFPSVLKPAQGNQNMHSLQSQPGHPYHHNRPVYPSQLSSFAQQQTSFQAYRPSQLVSNQATTSNSQRPSMATSGTFAGDSNDGNNRPNPHRIQTCPSHLPAQANAQRPPGNQENTGPVKYHKLSSPATSHQLHGFPSSGNLAISGQAKPTSQDSQNIYSGFTDLPEVVPNFSIGQEDPGSQKPSSSDTDEMIPHIAPLKISKLAKPTSPASGVSTPESGSNPQSTPNHSNPTTFVKPDEGTIISEPISTPEQSSSTTNAVSVSDPRPPQHDIQPSVPGESASGQLSSSTPNATTAAQQPASVLSPVSTVLPHMLPKPPSVVPVNSSSGGVQTLPAKNPQASQPISQASATTHHPLPSQPPKISPPPTQGAIPQTSHINQGTTVSQHPAKPQSTAHPSVPINNSHNGQSPPHVQYTSPAMQSVSQVSSPAYSIASLHQAPPSSIGSPHLSSHSIHGSPMQSQVAAFGSSGLNHISNMSPQVQQQPVQTMPISHPGQPHKPTVLPQTQQHPVKPSVQTQQQPIHTQAHSHTHVQSPVHNMQPTALPGVSTFINQSAQLVFAHQSQPVIQSQQQQQQQLTHSVSASSNSFQQPTYTQQQGTTTQTFVTNPQTTQSQFASSQPNVNIIQSQSQIQSQNLTSGQATAALVSAGKDVKKWAKKMMKNPVLQQTTAIIGGAIAAESIGGNGVQGAMLANQVYHTSQAQQQQQQPGKPTPIGRPPGPPHAQSMPIQTQQVSGKPPGPIGCPPGPPHMQTAPSQVSGLSGPRPPIQGANQPTPGIPPQHQQQPLGAQPGRPPAAIDPGRPPFVQNPAMGPVQPIANQQQPIGRPPWPVQQPPPPNPGHPNSSIVPDWAAAAGSFLGAAFHSVTSGGGNGTGGNSSGNSNANGGSSGHNEHNNSSSQPAHHEQSQQHDTSEAHYDYDEQLQHQESALGYHDQQQQQQAETAQNTYYDEHMQQQQVVIDNSTTTNVEVVNVVNVDSTTISESQQYVNAPGYAENNNSTIMVSDTSAYVDTTNTTFNDTNASASDYYMNTNAVATVDTTVDSSVYYMDSTATAGTATYGEETSGLAGFDSMTTTTTVDVNVSTETSVDYSGGDWGDDWDMGF